MPKKISMSIGQSPKQIPLEMDTKLHSFVSALIEQYPEISVAEGLPSEARLSFLTSTNQLPPQADSFANGYAVRLATSKPWDVQVNDDVCTKVYEVANAVGINVHYIADGIVVEDSKYFVEE